MTSLQEGGPAFPTLDDNTYFHGMTLRDYFAGQALAGYFAAPNTQHRNAADSEVAEYVYAMSDAPLAAREKWYQS